MRVLIAGETLDRRSLSDQLAVAGCEIVHASGADVERRARDGGVDIAVLAADLGEQTGADVCQRLRANGSWLPVVVLVPGRRNADGRIVALEAGADDAVPDDVSVPELVARLWARAHVRSPR